MEGINVDELTHRMLGSMNEEVGKRSERGR